MTKYVDGFVLTVRKDQLDLYKEMAELGKRVWMKHGALNYKECMMDHANPEGVEFTFPKMAQATEEEVVFFSYIEFESRAHRDEVNAKVMSDPEMNHKDWEGKMPFDMKKFAYGGFEVFVG